MSVDCHTEAFAFHSDSVEKWMFHELFLEVLVVVNGVPHDREGGHCDVVELIDEGIVQSLTGEARVESEIVLGHNIEYVFVESVCDQKGISSISFSTVDEQQWFKEFELANCKISGSSSLLSLFA